MATTFNPDDETSDREGGIIKRTLPFSKSFGETIIAVQSPMLLIVLLSVQQGRVSKSEALPTLPGLLP